MPDRPEKTSRSSKRITPLPVGLLYGAMALAAYGLGFWLAGRNVFVWHDAFGTTLEIDVALGAGAGVAVVLLSRVLERAFEWARQLSRSMRALMGELDGLTILVIAVSSAIGEEMLFRGLLQPAIGIVWSSLVFGLLHIGPNRTYLPWTVMAIGMGFGFGGLFYYTGNLLAPILAHFTINFFNLTVIARETPSQSEPT